MVRYDGEQKVRGALKPVKKHMSGLEHIILMILSSLWCFMMKNNKNYFHWKE